MRRPFSDRMLNPVWKGGVRGFFFAKLALLRP